MSTQLTMDLVLVVFAGRVKGEKFEIIMNWLLCYSYPKSGEVSQKKKSFFEKHSEANLLHWYFAIGIFSSA